MGPFDLSGSMGKLGELNDPEVKNAIDHVRTACNDHNKPAGIFSVDSESANQYLEAGFDFAAVGIDVNYVWKYAEKLLKEIKNQERC